MRRYDGAAAFEGAGADLVTIDAILCMGHGHYDDPLFARMPRLRALLSAVTGVEGFDIDAATARGIAVSNGQTELNYIGMAEATILMILACLYDLAFTQTVLRQNLPRPTPLRARLLRGRRLGFIGFGRIAQEVALRLQPWGLEMVAYVHRDNPAITRLGVEQVELDELLRRCDIVSLNCSLNETTHHIINAERLALMRPDAVLINAARGALIDEAALFTALSTGQLAAAALDVFETEPLPENSPLRGLDNVLLTPHMIGHTNECNETLMENAWINLLRVEQGSLPHHLKNPDVRQGWIARMGMAQAG
ncbi:MAG: NAD(P)-dependent oxidoreductase [Acidocella sp.]|nr:NAD(P)-dependent oxidoreductase [Acidocella sp.]